MPVKPFNAIKSWSGERSCKKARRETRSGNIDLIKKFVFSPSDPPVFSRFPTAGVPPPLALAAHGVPPDPWLDTWRHARGDRPYRKCAISAGTPWRDVHKSRLTYKPSYRLRTVDRHRLASVGGLVLGLQCSWCRGNAPMPALSGLHAAPWKATFFSCKRRTADHLEFYKLADQTRWVGVAEAQHERELSKRGRQSSTNMQRS